ncbi:MAG: orotidine-5'-phosphate decarboxylase [Actinobacteria bacterium]|nr:orotidine-5'-phosphate decarboxylase [Actinomycetota bacterium]
MEKYLKNLKINDRLIISIDASSKQEVITLCNRINNNVTTLKLGLELIYSCGLDIINTVKSFGYKVMLDAKLLDIPNTVYGAIAAISKLGVDKITIHALGGRKMLAAAKQKLAEESSKSNIIPPSLFAVTILTSLDDEDLDVMGFKKGFLQSVINLASIAIKNGIDGTICSPNEVKSIRKKLGSGFYIATPGIRLDDDDKGDQKRINTPYNAIKDGADFIIVGRSITTKVNPEEVIKKFFTEIERALV